MFGNGWNGVFKCQLIIDWSIMNSQQYLKLFSAPLEIKIYESYRSKIENHLQIFENKTKLFLKSNCSNQEATFILKTIKETSDSIKDILKSFESGKKSLIYSKFDDLLTNNQSINNILRNNIETYNQGSKYFRIRLGNIDPSNKNKHDIFHIPFSKRYLVSNLRFNGNGTPCFYLASDAIVAWRETGEPKVDKVNLAVFYNSQTIKILDLSLKTYSILGENKQKLVEYICLYPLIMAIHTKISYQENHPNFKYEYLFPSLLMDWFLSEENRFDTIVLGIKYRSVKINSKDTDYNYVLRTKYTESQNKQYCENLEKIFLDTNIASLKYKYYYTEELKKYHNKVNKKNDTFHQKIFNNFGS